MVLVRDRLALEGIQILQGHEWLVRSGVNRLPTVETAHLLYALVRVSVFLSDLLRFFSHQFVHDRVHDNL